MLYDGAGREIWACPNVDSRSGQEAVDLIAEGAAERSTRAAATGCRSPRPARLRWLARHRPDILAATRGLGMLSDWIATRLSGVLATEPSCGSSSGMFSLADRTWSAKIAAICGLDPSVLPPVSDPGTVIGTVTAAAAGGDRACAQAPRSSPAAPTPSSACSASAPGRASTRWSAARSGRTRSCSTGRSSTREIRLRTLCHVVPGQWMLEGIGFYCGMSMRWFRDAFCAAQVARGPQPRRRSVRRDGGGRRAGAGWLGGMIAILSNVMNARRWAHASPSFLQFDLGQSGWARGQAACVRAIEEAAAFVARGHRDIIAELTGSSFTELVFTGGAAKGTLWPQIMADVLGTPVHVPGVTESSALGAAICAGVGVGIYSEPVRT